MTGVPPSDDPWRGGPSSAVFHAPNERRASRTLARMTDDSSSATGLRRLVSGLGLLVTRTIGRWIPDPFVLAIGLTVLTAALVLALPGTFPGRDPDGPSKATLLLDVWWNGGLWKLLAFSMQMALVLVTGYALAASPPVRRAIDSLAGLPRSAGSGAALVALVAVLTGLINWGLALVVGALLARAVGRGLERRGLTCHYPLLAAAGYTGLLVWHGGFSGSAPLKMTTAAAAAEILPASIVAEHAAEGIPLSQTLLSPMNLFVAIGLIVIVPLGAMLLTPVDRGELRSARDLGIGFDDDDAPIAADDRGGMIQTLLGLGLGVTFLAGFAIWLASDAGGIGRLGLDQINAAMFGLGLVLHGSPVRYLRAVEDAAKGCAGIIVQFPLYAGVMAMMSASGLLAMFADAANAMSTPGTLPLLTMSSAAVVNIFVPSGGGQWAVQGPIALTAGADAGVPLGKMVMSVAYGDQLTNMLQPFWALPLLAITGVKARDIVGYTTILMLLAGAWIGVGLLVF
jgi:short-chain fatty acids transporter